MRKITSLLPYSVKHRVNRARINLSQQWSAWRTKAHLAAEKRHEMPLYWAYRLYIRRETPVIIYQMGKVGSTSVYVSLRRAGRFALHTHSFDAAWFDDYFNPQTRNAYRVYFPAWDWMRRHIIAANRPAKFITLIRDPVAINISFFFHILDLSTGVENSVERLTLDELLAHYDRFQAATYNYMQVWFANEFQRHLGIDVFAHNFDRQKGMGRIQQTPYEVLLLHLDMPDDQKASLIGDFLALPGFSIQSANTAAEKDYATVYRAFKQAVRIPEATLEQVYSSPLATHFYTPDQIARFRARWSKHHVNQP